MNRIESTSLQAYKLFSMIAEAGKLTKAARRLKMSQSGASHALKALETSLGVELFKRDREGLTLSETGIRLLPRVRNLLRDLDAIREEVSALANLQTGILRIAAVPSVAATVLPQIIRKYAQSYPGIEVSLFEGTDDEVRDWVASGVVHVGFAALPVSGVDCEEITQDEWLALVPSDRFAHKHQISLLTLSRCKFLMSGGGCEPHIERLFEGAGVQTPPYTPVKQLATIGAMVAEGLGVSIVPSLACGTVLKGIRAISLTPKKFRRIGVLRSYSSPMTPAEEAWLTRTRNYFCKRPATKAKQPS